MYQTEINGKHYELGTSGFLYRSNKLMYDVETKSFWSTLQGTPVVGPLVGKGLALERGHVVTSTWGEWKRRHPNTTVLSLSTGHIRNYDEGAAYKDYFSSHKLMFQVPETDGRLENKSEVVALRRGEDQLAVSAAYLAKHPVFHAQIDGQNLVILTDRSGANRVYVSGENEFLSFDGKAVIDDGGASWTVTEDSITPTSGDKLMRLPAHRVFWFGWYAQYPKTRLIYK